MNTNPQLTLDDLQQMCDERREESVTLEFKSCNELRVGSRMKNGRERTRDTIIDELTKDVSALLNSAGGTLIYGIRESNSRAKELDRKYAFRREDKIEITPEKITQWLRDHIQPPPTVYAYTVLENDNNPGWYLVIGVPPGQRAYMARDYRHYKRVGNQVRLMERYEIDDVMNRMRGADLDLRIRIHSIDPVPGKRAWYGLNLYLAVTSTNFLASEYGMLKLSIAYPAKLWQKLAAIVPASAINRNAFIPELPELDFRPRAQSVNLRWGSNQGNVVFPGDWYDFHNNTIRVEVPVEIPLCPDPTFLIRTELYTLNSHNKVALYAISEKRASSGEKSHEITSVNSSNYDSVISRFKTTYDASETVDLNS
ncbi:MAG: ATP-binding protein [Anaerolineae bacterium]|nr:ATP-binding protein [Anaerolineae bacterium]